MIIASNILTTKPLSNTGGGGFDAYVYPEWSTILGWFIFSLCIIPIPLVYVVTYIREYRSLKSTKAIQPSSDDEMEKPAYLKALSEVNQPDADWGPMKSVNQHGLYKHLNDIESDNEIDYDLSRSSIVTKEKDFDEKYFPKMKSLTP